MDRESAARRSVLPEGVELREGKRSSSLRVTFYWQSRRCRETLDIPATPANIKYAGRLVAEIKNAIERGTFDYAATFPNSKTAKLAVKSVRQLPTIGELLDRYIDIGRRTGSLSPSSIACYARWNRARLQPKWGDTRIDNLTTADLRMWIVDLVSELAPKSIRNCVGILSTILNLAHADGLITANPLAPIKLRTLLPKRKRAGDDDKIDPFNDVEIAAILSACPNNEERSLFQFAFSTGLRIGELIAIKWQHIDWKTGMIHVQDNVVSAEIGTVEKTTKTDNERDVPILPAAREALLAMQPISAAKAKATGGYIFLHPLNGKRWRNEHQIRDRWEIILRDAKMRYRNPYQTRHTFASRLLASGEQELLVAKLLGHANVEMVRRHYGRYIKQPDGIVLRGDYSQFGATNCPNPAPNSGKTAACG